MRDTGFLAIAGLLAFACVSDSAPREWLGSIDTLPSGIVQVVNPAQGMWDSRSAWRIEEDLRIGSLDGGPEEFSRITDLEVDQWGRIYVLQGPEVRVFNTDGEYVRTVGRSGGGPGEFKGPIGIDIDSMGRLWVTDAMNLRYTVFDSSGALHLIRSRHDRFVPFGGDWADRIGVDGTFYDTDIHSLAPSVFERRYFRLDTALSPIDTIAVPPYDRTPSTELRPPRPYPPRIRSVLDGRGYVWCALTTEYRIVQLRFPGDTVRSVERAFEPPAVTDDERAAIEEALRRGNREIGLPGTRQQVEIPSHKPALARFFVDAQGYLWTVPYGANDGETRTLDVFDPEGRYLGEARANFTIGLERTAMPSVGRGTPIIVRGNHLYAVSFDDWDVPYVVRARIDGR